MTKVSIIVPVYNEQSTVVALLEKVNHQTVDAFEFEIIVIDDGSQDETVSQLKAHPDLYRKLIERQKKWRQRRGSFIRSGRSHGRIHFVSRCRFRIRSGGLRKIARAGQAFCGGYCNGKSLGRFSNHSCFILLA